MYPKLTSALYLIAWKPADNIFIDIFMWLISSLEEILFEISDNWLFHYLGLMLSSVSRNSSTGRVWNSLQTLLLSGLKQNVGIFKYVQNLTMNCILFMGKYCSMQALLWWQQQQQQHNNVSVSSSLLSAVRCFCYHRESKEPKEGVVGYGYISGTVVVQIWAIPNPRYWDKWCSHSTGLLKGFLQNGCRETRSAGHARRRRASHQYINIWSSAILLIAPKHMSQSVKDQPHCCEPQNQDNKMRLMWTAEPQTLRPRNIQPPRCITLRSVHEKFFPTFRRDYSVSSHQSASTSGSTESAKIRTWAMIFHPDVSRKRIWLFSAAGKSASKAVNQTYWWRVHEQFSWYSLIVLEAAMQQLRSETA